jgi:hypothetical protein
MEILREHPGVFVPPNKGTVFFTRFHGQGVAWFEQFFAKATDQQVVGELCEEYLSSPEAIMRIREYRPDMRLICCLRNPYERAISAWQFYGRNGCDHPTLAAQAECNPEVFTYGYYASQLEVVRSLFPDEQLLVFLYDDITSRPLYVARRLYQFIGADPGFVPPSVHQRVNRNGRPRWRLLARIVHKIHVRSWGSSRLVSNLAGYMKSVRPLRRAVRTILYDERPRQSDWRRHFAEFPADVVARYEREISALEQMLNLDLSRWRAPTATHDEAAAHDEAAVCDEAAVRDEAAARDDDLLIDNALRASAGNRRP